MVRREGDKDVSKSKAEEAGSICRRGGFSSERKGSRARRQMNSASSESLAWTCCRSCGRREDEGTRWKDTPAAVKPEICAGLFGFLEGLSTLISGKSVLAANWRLSSDTFSSGVTIPRSCRSMSAA